MHACLQDLMRPVISTVLPGETLRAAETRLLEAGTSEVYVVDGQHGLLGVVSDYEILKARLAGVPGDALVAGFISRHVDAFDPEFPVERLAAILRDGRYAQVPVVAEGRLVGRVTRRDVLRALADRDEQDPTSGGAQRMLLDSRIPVQATVDQTAAPEGSVPRPRYLSAGQLTRDLG